MTPYRLAVDFWSIRAWRRGLCVSCGVVDGRRPFRWCSKCGYPTIAAMWSWLILGQAVVGSIFFWLIANR